METINLEVEKKTNIIDTHESLFLKCLLQKFSSFFSIYTFQVLPLS